MNKMNIILVVIVLIGLVSCGNISRKLVDLEKSDLYAYSLLGNKIVYSVGVKREYFLIFPIKNKEVWRTMSADAKTFRVIDGHIGQDSLHTFYQGIIVDYLDVETFKKLEGSYNTYVDKNNVYKLDIVYPDGHYTRKPIIIEMVHRETFHIIGNEFFERSPYAKDKNHIYLTNKPINVDYDSFKILSDKIVADKNYIWDYSPATGRYISNPNGSTTDLVNSNGMVCDKNLIYTIEGGKIQTKPLNY